MALRVTRQQVDVASTGADTKIRVTRQMVAVLTNGSASTTHNESASSSLIFSDSATSGLKKETVSQSLIFSQTAVGTGPLNFSEADSLIFGQTVGVSGIRSVSGSSSLIFSQSVGYTPVALSASSNLIFSQSAGLPTDLAAEPDTVIFTHQAWADSIGFTQTVTFNDTAVGVKIIPGGLERSASSGLVFTDNGWAVHILATAQDLSASSGLVFGQFAGFPQEYTFTDGIIFSHVIVEELTYLFEHDLIFEQSVGTEFERVLSASDNLFFQHAFMFENIEGSTCQYDPILGYSSDPDAPTPPSLVGPTLVPYDNVRLYYPLTTPTMAVEIRAPRMGDRDRLTNTRINRESRGGTLQVFADPSWPKIQSLVLSFTGLSETQAQSVQSFFLSTLGLTVGLRDWDGRTWHGIVINPDEPLIRSRRGIVDMSFEFDGELQ